MMRTESAGGAAHQLQGGAVRLLLRCLFQGQYGRPVPRLPGVRQRTEGSVLRTEEMGRPLLRLQLLL